MQLRPSSKPFSAFGAICLLGLPNPKPWKGLGWVFSPWISTGGQSKNKKREAGNGETDTALLLWTKIKVATLVLKDSCCFLVLRLQSNWRWSEGRTRKKNPCWSSGRCMKRKEQRENIFEPKKIWDIILKRRRRRKDHEALVQGQTWASKRLYTLPLLCTKLLTPLAFPYVTQKWIGK